MNTVLGDNNMSEKTRTCLPKPPVPARPKNLVVLNSKHLPKPPETFSTENVTNFIKDLNLDVKGEDNDVSRRKVTSENASNSDLDDDTDGYLEPTSLSDSSQSIRKANGQSLRKKSSYEENSKLSEIFRKVVNRNNSGSLETSEVEETKPQISQRPLPLPPVETKSEVTSMPWYKNVDREGSEGLLGNGVDGYFLIRPSSQVDTYLVLSLSYKSRVYNIPIRRKRDGSFALGTPRARERCFESVEHMIRYFQSEKLVIICNGTRVGKTVLTAYPP